MTVLQLGNTSVVEVFKQVNEDGSPKVDADGRQLPDQRVERPDLGNKITKVEFPAGVAIDEQLKIVRELWTYHSDADGPEWVESDDDALARVIAGMFTTETHMCVVGRPADWQED